MSGRPPHRRLLFGTTSYVLPADLIPNVQLLAPLVEDIELILFEGEVDNLPTPEEVAVLRRLAQEGGCGFTVHLPLDVGLGESEESYRRRGQETCLRVMELTRPLEPRAYVMHAELPLKYHPAFGEMVRPMKFLPGEVASAWTEALHESLTRLIGEAGGCLGQRTEQTTGSPLARERQSSGPCLAVENLNYPYEWVWDLVEDLDLGVVLDVGHLLMSGGEVAQFLKMFGDRLRVVHLHGLEGGKDHRPVSLFPAGELRTLLEGFRGSGAQVGRVPLPVTCEVFGIEPLVPSLQALAAVTGQECARQLIVAVESLQAGLPKSMG